MADKRVRGRVSTALFFIAALGFLSSGAIGPADGKTVAAVLGFLAGARWGSPRNGSLQVSDL